MAQDVRYVVLCYSGLALIADPKADIGDVFYLNAAGNNIIVLNSRKAAIDLLERRSAIYSDRPRLIVTNEIMARGLFWPLTGYNDMYEFPSHLRFVVEVAYGTGCRWRKMRKVSNEALSKGASKTFQEYQTREALLLARGMIRNPANLDRQMNRAAASVMMTCLYGGSSVRVYL